MRRPPASTASPSPLPLALVAFVSLAACSGGGGPGDAGAGPEEVHAAGPDASEIGPVEAEPDVSPEIAGGDLPPSEPDPGPTADGTEPDADAATEPETPAGPGGVTDGTGIVTAAADLEGLFWYGVGVEPGTPLGSFEEWSAVGVLVLPVVVELGDGEVSFRVFDLEEGAAVEGSDGLVESYPAEELRGGDVRIDFAEPLVGLEIQLSGSCLYKLEGYALEGDPVYAGGLLTWPALELYASSKCGGRGLQSSLGINVHFLRRFDAGAGYAPREVDSEAPFGFFQAGPGDPDDEDAVRYLTRQAGVHAGAPPGSIVYEVNPGFPEALRPVVDEVLEGWNDVLETAVGARPFAAVDAVEERIPWDPRYRVFHWDPQKTFGAIAPFVEVPETGEMFDTDVLVWLADMTEVVTKYKEFHADHPDVPIDRPAAMPYEAKEAEADWNDPAALPPRVLRRRPYELRPFSPAVVGKALSNLAEDASDEEVQAHILADYLTHEFGHNLGLRHNFKGSIDRDLHPPEATSTSCMDYVVGTTRPGTYDLDAMRYAYGDGAFESGYLFCTDEDLELDPGCAQWDFGHPVSHFLSVLDDLSAEHPPDTPLGAVEAAANEGQWEKLFRRVRLFVGTEYESWDPEAPVSVVGDLLDRVACLPSDAACPHHLWFRTQLALYLLYTKFVAESDGEWHEFPALSETEAPAVLGAYFDLVLDPAQPKGLKAAIVGKLPTANVPGAKELLDEIEAALLAIEAPTPEELEVLGLVQAAKATP